GGFLKREARPSDKEVLTSRLIDRPIRPMIPKTWNFETQIIATTYSFDPSTEPATLGAIGASAALMISDIPFEGPISEVNVGRIDGEFVLNPSHEQLKESDIDMTVAGTDDSIAMVEGESKEISEEEFLEVLEYAHKRIVELNTLQKKLAKLVKVKKREFEVVEIPEEITAFVDKKMSKKIDKHVHKISSKDERDEWRTAVREKALEEVLKKFKNKDGEEDNEADLTKYCGMIVDKLEKSLMRKMITKDGVRLDGRKTDEIRQIKCEVGVLPRAHGSALFTRGETQSLSTATLGTKRDEQMIDGLLPTYTNNFYLHYNFPPFCTGEVKRMGLSRREVGHGHLAERSLRMMFPDIEEFPYAVRVISDILESNGSSSMATVCAGSLALFHAGVPMKKPVAGIAMGLIKEDKDIAVLSDILGDEDFLGDMDFKVTGTSDGITACQMDIKIKGLPIDIMKQALAQAKVGREHILEIMNEVLDAPNDDVSQYAPRFSILMIPQDTIGSVIGPGGETIRSIVAETNTDVNIDDDGKVTIAATSKEESDAAVEMIKSLIQKPEAGTTYKGVIKEIREGLGCFVEFMPKRQGLLHISEISYERTETIEDVLKVGEEVEVKLLEVTRDGKYRLSLRALLPKPEGWVERERPPRSNNYNRGGDRRGGDRRDNRR
ncbi:MAG: polyribonucleotide nucleotidyltransferase, partial [Chlorobi bacterium]|nr:polyribonucleotide nucleotidyltransferase [Chlorobiota bacterium]